MRIQDMLSPVPQQIILQADEPLTLTTDSRFHVTAPHADSGPVRTALEKLQDHLTRKCGSNCFADDGLPVILELGCAPDGLHNAAEAYRLQIRPDGITVTGFGPSGLLYGVFTLLQLLRWEDNRVSVPAADILDWPDNPFRAYKQECRYGSNLMERQDWFDMIDDLAEKKINHLSLAIYGCWVMQYDGRVAEYLYLPLKKYPQFKTPMTVKYWSPSEGKWYDYETLPPIYRDDLLGDIVRYCKDRGIHVIPGINSLGHNTLFPRMLPQVAPKNEDGTTNPTGFCTSCDETYQLLFSVYDQIIDEYLLPNEMYTFNILLDEVWDQFGVDPENPYVQKSAWCRCPKCRERERTEIFIEHAVKVLKHLKEKGMKSVIIANDMLARKVSKLGYFADKFMARIDEEGLRDVLFLDWWCYKDIKEQVDFVVQPDELGLRSFFCPWNGYYIWNMLTNPLRNCQIMAEMNHNAKCGEGVYLYAMWDRSYDRIHDCFADYGWNFAASGSVEDVTDRYVARHFAPLQEQVRHAYRLMDWITEERPAVKDAQRPLETVLNPMHTLLRELGYYYYSYFKPDQPYPRHFPGNGLSVILPWRRDYERLMYCTASMAKEALAIFRQAAETAGCDRAMALRMAYECENYQVLVEDWIAFLQIYDLTQNADQKKIVPIARRRQHARAILMEHCEQIKEAFVLRSATMRNHSIFMQTFADIADYVECHETPKLDLMDITAITSSKLLNLR